MFRSYDKDYRYKKLAKGRGVCVCVCVCVVTSTSPGYGEIGTLVCCGWQCKMMSWLWKMVWRFLKNRPTMSFSNPMSRYLSRLIGNRLLKSYLHSYGNCSIFHNGEEVKSRLTVH